MIGRVLLGVLLVTLSVIPAAPARADGEIELSLDGQQWAEELRTPLFDPALRWVPGDMERASFHVRNQGPSSAVLTVGLRSSDPDLLLANDDIVISARVGKGGWLALTNDSPSTDLTHRVIRQGGSAHVDLRVEFRWESTNRSQATTLPLTLEVRLTQHGRVTGAGPHDGLPATGAPIAPWLVWFAAALLGIGLSLVMGARREPDEEVRAGE